MINNRQNGRRRGRGGARPQGVPQGNARDNRQRGNAAQLLEKYKTLARDAQMAGDRVQTEYYLQFADHYYRVLGESRARFEEQRRPHDAFRDDDDDGEEFDGDEDAGQSERDDRYERADTRDDEGRDTGSRDDRGRRARPERGERFERADRERADRGDRERADRGERDRAERGERDRTDRNDRDRGERDRSERDRNERDRGERDRGQRGDRPRFRREERTDERPREIAAASAEPVLNGAEAQGHEGERLDVAILPPAIGVIANEGEPVEGADAPKPRRRARRPRVAAADAVPNDTAAGQDEAPVAAE